MPGRSEVEPSAITGRMNLFILKQARHIMSPRSARYSCEHTLPGHLGLNRALGLHLVVLVFGMREPVRILDDVVLGELRCKWYTAAP